MNIKYIIIFALGLLCMATSCSKDSNVDNYVLKIKSEIENADSVKLLVYEPDYNNLRVLNAGKFKNGEVTLSGQIKHQAIAFLNYGKKKPVAFILEKCETEITIGKERVIIWGGSNNHDYLAKCKQIYNLEKNLEEIRLEYKKGIADSTLNKKKEANLLKSHKLLADSLQNLITNTIKKNNETSTLFKEKFINRLDSAKFKEL